MLFWSELVEGGAVHRQRVFLNAGIIACSKYGIKHGQCPIHNPPSHRGKALPGSLKPYCFEIHS